MPTFKLPRFWRAQLLALLAMPVVWALMFAYTYSLNRHYQPGAGYAPALALTTLVWMYPVLAAPFFVFGGSPRRLAMAKALARFTAIVGSTFLSLAFTVLFISWFIPSDVALKVIAVLLWLVICPLFMRSLTAEMDKRFNTLNLPSQPCPA